MFEPNWGTVGTWLEIAHDHKDDKNYTCSGVPGYKSSSRKLHHSSNKSSYKISYVEDHEQGDGQEISFSPGRLRICCGLHGGQHGREHDEGDVEDEEAGVSLGECVPDQLVYRGPLYLRYGGTGDRQSSSFLVRGIVMVEVTVELREQHQREEQDRCCSYEVPESSSNEVDPGDRQGDDGQSCGYDPRECHADQKSINIDGVHGGCYRPHGADEHGTSATHRAEANLRQKEEISSPCARLHLCQDCRQDEHSHHDRV